MGASSNPLAAGVASLKPPSTTQTMISPDGQYGEIPVERVQDAISAGFKAGMNMISPDGSMGTVPVDKAHDAMAAGFKPSGLTLPESKLYAQHPANVLYRNIRQNETPEQIAARQQTAQNASQNIQTTGNVLGLAGGLVAAPVATAAGLVTGLAGQYGGTKAAKAAGVDDTTAQQIGDVTGLATGIAGGMASEAAEPAIAKLSQKLNPGDLIRNITGTTPERIAELQDVPQKIADIRQLAIDAEAKAKSNAKAAYPQINTPVKIGSPVPEADPYDPTAALDAKQTEIPFKQAQEQYSQLALDARAAHVARMQGRITGFDEADILQRKSELGDAMQDAADADGKLDQFNAARKQFADYMNDFHNRGSAVEPLLETNPSDTVKIANHFLNPDRGARTVSVLSKYGIDTSPITDLLSEGGTPLKIDVNEAQKLSKVGPEGYAQQRLQESIDQAEFNRLQSSAQARLPAWAMRKTSEIPLIPDALQPNIPTRFLISKLLRSNLAKNAVQEGATQLSNLNPKP